MHPSIHTQLWRLATLFLLGILCNIIFQAYTALRGATSPKKLTAHILDGIVAIVVLIIVSSVIFVVNYWEVRLYIPVTLMMGFFFSNILVGNIVYNISFCCATVITKIIRNIKQHITTTTKMLKDKVLMPFINRFKTPPQNKNPNT